jgi:hypothetical protein
VASPGVEESAELAPEFLPVGFAFPVLGSR